MLSTHQLENIHGRQARIVAEGAHAMTGERELIVFPAKQLWNPSAALEIVGGDEDLLNEMVQLFLVESPKLVAQMTGIGSQRPAPTGNGGTLSKR